MWIVLILGTAAAILGRRLELSRDDRALSERAVRIATVTLVLAALSVAVAQTIVVSVLGAFASALGTDTVGATWLLTVFMLASAVATPIGGRLGDLIGHRSVIITGLVLLIVGSAIAAVSVQHHAYAGTVAGRVVQGLAGGVFPCAFGYARQSLPAHQVARLVPVLSAVFGVGGAIGMVVAGPLVDVAGLSSVFWAVAVLAMVAALGATVIPAVKVTREGSVDLPGAVALAGLLVALLMVISQGNAWGWTSVRTLGLVVALVACGAVFTLVERRAAAPLIDLRLLAGRRFVALNVATTVIGVGLFAAVALVPLLAQSSPDLGYGFGFGPTGTGLLIVPMAVCMVIAGPVAAWSAGRFGARAVLQSGAGLAAVGLASLGVLHSNPASVAVGGAVLGIAYGLAFGGLGTLVVTASPADQTGVATGINTILRTVGGAVGAVVASSIVAATAAAPSSTPTDSGYVWAFCTGAIMAGCAGLIAIAIPGRR
ncbi:MFS transporter [Gordonia sp. (in: high G+C Gram-positive bacteria)]|uniref:MFS transporter n=1 Tax=Gordonia sp. (in: high G+C Gram-positive bacteria) TaxID=84139 RepID=UPI003F994FC9